jgi:hypothetical protein
MFNLLSLRGERTFLSNLMSEKPRRRRRREFQVFYDSSHSLGLRCRKLPGRPVDHRYRYFHWTREQPSEKRRLWRPLLQRCFVLNIFFLPSFSSSVLSIKKSSDV